MTRPALDGTPWRRRGATARDALSEPVPVTRVAWEALRVIIAVVASAADPVLGESGGACAAQRARTKAVVGIQSRGAQVSGLCEERCARWFSLPLRVVLTTAAWVPRWGHHHRRSSSPFLNKR